MQWRRAGNEDICKLGLTALGDGLERRSERGEVLRVTARFLVKATGSAEFLFMEIGEMRGGAGLDLKIRTSPAVSAPGPGALGFSGLFTCHCLGFLSSRRVHRARCLSLLAAHTHKPQR